MALLQPIILLLIGIGLSVQPYFSDTRWVWNGIPTNYAGYVFAVVGFVWSGAAAIQMLRGETPED